MTTPPPRPSSVDLTVAIDHGSPCTFAVAEDFIEDSSFHGDWMSPSQMMLARLDPAALADRERRSGRDLAHLPAVRLDRPMLPGGLHRSLLRRSSAGGFEGSSALPATAVGSVVWAAYGVNRPGVGDDVSRYTSPTAGGLSSFDLHVMVRRCVGIAPGWYRYDSAAHCLRLESASPDWAGFDASFPHQQDLAGFAVCLVYVFVTGRVAFKYGARGWRFGFLDTGHSAQNALLAASSLGIASRPVGGFYDRALASVLDVDGVDEVPLHTVFLGGRG